MTVVLILGVLSALLFIVSAFIAIVRKTVGVNIVSALLLVAATGLLVAVSTLNDGFTVFVMISAIVLLVAGIVLAVLERNATQKIGHGLSAIGVGVFILAAIFGTPAIQSILGDAAEQNAALDLSTQVSEARAAATNRSNLPPPVADASAVVPVGFEQQTAPSVAQPEPTIAPTPFTFELPTPVPPICNGIVNANLNFREAPDVNADRIDVIPEGAVINIYERDETGEWLRTILDNRSGWISASIVTIDGDC
ncbi:MAG: SH3 domain-containing protein [Chloroflexota bacterium]